MTVLELLHLLKEGEVTPTQLVQQSIDTIKKNDDAINAVVHPRFEAALKESKRDYSNTVFKGMPILLKSLGQNLRGEPSTAASLLLKDSISNTTDHFVQRYWIWDSLCWAKPTVLNLGLRISVIQCCMEMLKTPVIPPKHRVDPVAGLQRL